jgi:hypothetical protein
MLYARLNLCSFKLYIYNFVSGLPCNQELGDISENRENCLFDGVSNQFTNFVIFLRFFMAA